MPASGEGRDEPQLYNFQRKILGNHPLAERDNVAVIVLPREPRCFQIPAKRAADAPHFIGNHRFTVSRSAEHDAALEFAAGHRFRSRTDEQWIVDRSGAERAEIADFVAERGQ